MLRSLCCTLVLLLLYVLPSNCQDWEIVCEANLCIESFTGYNDPDPNNSPIITASGFKINSNGATGQVNDYAAWSLNIVSSYISFEHADLSTAYEYRVTINSKTGFNNKELIFGFSTFPGEQNLTTIGSPVNVPAVTSPNIAGQDLSSDIFTLEEPGNYFITVLPRGSAISQNETIMVDNYRLERRAINTPTLLSFVTNQVDLDEGETGQLCIEITNPSDSEATLVDVTLSINGAPHFEAITSPQRITFQAGSSSVQCIDLNPQIFDASKVYKFSLNLVDEGNEAVLGTTPKAFVNISASDITCSCTAQYITICKGDQLTLSCAELENCSEYCTKWNPGEFLINGSTVDDLNITVAPEVSTTYIFSVSDDEGEIVHEVHFSVEVNESFEAFISASNPIACGQEPVELTVEPLGNEYLYNWQDQNESATRIINELGQYNVTVSNTETACSSVATFTLRDPDDIDASEEILSFFRNKGFLEFDINILGPTPFSPNGNETNFSPPTTEYVRDEANRLIQFDLNDPSELDLAIQIDTWLASEDYEGVTRKAFISANDNFCLPTQIGSVENIIAEIEGAYSEQEFGYWIHLWESPNEGEVDKFFIQGISLTHNGGFTPDSEIMSSYIYDLVENVKGESEIYNYDGKSEQLIEIILDQLEDPYDMSVEDRIEFQYSSETIIEEGGLHGCDGIIISESKIAVNVAGKPVTIPAGSLPVYRYGFANYEHDTRALTGFITPELENWVSVGNKDQLRHLGFREQKNPKKGESKKFPPIDDTNCMEVIAGEHLAYYYTYGNETYNCSDLTITELSYTSNLANSYIEDTREGIPRTNFEDPMVGVICNPNQQGNAYVQSDCIGVVSEQMLANEENGRFNPFGKAGILYKFDLDDDGEVDELIYARYEGNDLNTAILKYFAWSCADGGWIPFEPNEYHYDNFGVLASMYKTIFVDENGFTGHLLLDALSVIPIFGAPADLASAIWYVVEGEYGNAGLSLIGVIPFLGDGITAARLVLEQGQVLVKYNGISRRVKSVFKMKCVTGFTGGGSLNMGMLSPAYILNSSPPPCNLAPEFITFIDKILDEGAAIINNFPGLTIDRVHDMVITLSNYPHPLGRNISALINQNPQLLRTWSKAIDEGLTPVQTERLFGWLASGIDNADEAVTAFTNLGGLGPELVKGWKFVDKIFGATNNRKKFDHLLMAKVTELIDNPTFLQRLSPLSPNTVDQLNKFEKILDNYPSVCHTCGTPSELVSHLPNIDVFLQNTFEFTENYSTIVGFDKVMMELLTARNFSEQAQLFRITSDQSLIGNITKLEPPLGNIPPQIIDDAYAEAHALGIVDQVEVEAFVGSYLDEVNFTLTNPKVGDYIANIEGIDNVFVELKSYSTHGFRFFSEVSENRKKTEQVMAYLSHNEVFSFNQIKYIFDLKKIELEFDNATDGLIFIKSKFKEMYLSRPGEFFDVIFENEGLKSALMLSNNPITAYSEFLVHLENTESLLYSFLHIQ